MITAIVLSNVHNAQIERSRDKTVNVKVSNAVEIESRINYLTVDQTQDYIIEVRGKYLNKV